MHKFLIILALAAQSVHASTNSLVPVDNAAEITRAMVKYIEKTHVSGRKLDDAIAERAIDIYLRSLDPDHSYFLEADLAGIRSTTLDDRLREGDVSTAYALFEIFKQRVFDRYCYISNALNTSLDLETDETYQWRRKNEPFPENRAEWDDLWNKKLLNEYIAIAVSDHLAEEKQKETAAQETGATNTLPAVAAATNAAAISAETNAVTAADSGGTQDTVEDRIRSRYERFRDSVDEIESVWVLDQYLSAFCRAFDPHCDYMPPAVAEEFNIEMSLSLVGIGAVLTLDGGAAKIMEIIPGGPADKDTRPGRLQPGDRIIAVAQEAEAPVDVMNWSLSKIVRLIRGKKNTEVRLTVVSESAETDDETRIVDLIRDEIKLEDRGAKKDIFEASGDDGVTRKVGVISLPAFYGDVRLGNDDAEGKSCADDVYKLLSELRKERVEGIVLNLRNNTGGSLREAGLLTGHFIPYGPVVLIRDGSTVSVLPDQNPEIAYAGPLVILVNRHTASAGEILAGALQDYGRAIVAGDSKTHGKGSVQIVHGLDESGELGSIKVTNAQFYRISGSSTQLKGVTSDVLIPSPLDYSETGEDHLPYALEWSMIRPANYIPYADIGETVRTVIQQSASRLQDDIPFTEYTNLLSRLRQLNEEEDLPLNYERRLSRAKTRQEFERIEQLFRISEDVANDGEDTAADTDENGASGDPASPGNENTEKDLVLHEALRVLCDLAALTPYKAWPGDPETILTIPAEKPLAEPDEELRAAVLALVDDLANDDGEIRRHALEQLMRLGPKAYPILKEFLNDDNLEIRTSVRGILYTD